MKLFYVPIPNKKSYANYEYSILNGTSVDYIPLENIINDDTLKNTIFGLWGFKIGKHNSEEYDKINVGDYIFFRDNFKIEEKKYQSFDGFGRIAKKMTDSAIGFQVWKDAGFEKLLVIDEYYQFKSKFLLSYQKDIIADLGEIDKEVWHRQYNMFRHWQMSDKNAEQMIETMKVLCNELYKTDYLINSIEMETNQQEENNIILKNRPTEKKGITTVRIGQGGLREKVLKKQHKCRLCGINDERLLIASHIKPWRASKNDEKLDLNNILLLCAQHDKLFDNGLITFSDDGNIMISHSLTNNNKKLLYLTSLEKINFNEKEKEYMKWHREHVFQKGN